MTPAKRSAPPAPRPGATLTRSELALLLACTEETVRVWARAGCPRQSNGRFRMPDVLAWLLARERATVEARLGKKHSPMNRKLEAEAALKELALKRENGELLLVQDFNALAERVVGGFAAVANGRLARFERDIVRTKTATDARRLTDRIRVALMEGAQEFADELERENDEASEEPVPAEPPPGKPNRRPKEG